MFDDLPLIEIEWNVLGTPANSGDTLISAGFRQLIDNLTTEAEFVLDGKQSSLQCTPISDYARQHFLYLQGFSVLFSREQYYTIRKNYPSYLLMYTLEGHGELEYENEKTVLSPYSGFLIDCRRPHYYHTAGSVWTHADIHFNGLFGSHIMDLWMKDRTVLFTETRDNYFLKEIHQILLDYVNNAASPYREYQVSCRLQNLLMDMILEKEKNSRSAEIPDTIRDIVIYLQNHYRYAVSLDELAEHALMSKYHMVREFKKYMGTSPIDYLIGLRISSSQQMLTETADRISDIAEINGFFNINNFINQFKKRTGMTPAEYRKLYAEKKI